MKQYEPRIQKALDKEGFRKQKQKEEKRNRNRKQKKKRKKRYETELKNDMKQNAEK